MTEIDQLAATLAQLTKALDDTGLVVDRALRARITRGHESVGMPEDAEVKVTLGSPAKPDSLEALRRACGLLFGVDLPADYLFFLRQHDGMRVDAVAPSDPDAPDAPDAPMPFVDCALFSSAGVLEWRDSMSYGSTAPDGSSETRRPPVLPFYDFSGGSCVGFASSAGVGSPLRVVDVDCELVWKPAEYEVLASSFAQWFEAFLSVGCEATATQARLRALRRQRRAQSTVAADLIVPLALKRSRARLVLATCMMLFGVWGMTFFSSEWSVGLVLRLVVALVVLAACVRRFVSKRYLIEIDERGILDGFTQPQRIPWHAISDISCEGGEEDAALLLALGSQRVSIDLGGVQAPMQTVLRSAISYWQAAKEARELRDD